jgi:hypothetical protein
VTLRSPLLPNRTEFLRSPLQPVFGGRPIGPVQLTGCLLQEDGFRLLQEDDFCILLEPTFFFLAQEDGSFLLQENDFKISA